MIRTYSELSLLSSYEDRLSYLKLNGQVGSTTFGVERVFNQVFYKSQEWKNIRKFVILRDMGCDLGVKGLEIPDGIPIFIHHMNPITYDDIQNRSEILLDPEYLITTILSTHNFIHYGVRSRNDIPEVSLERTKNDTCPWKK